MEFKNWFSINEGFELPFSVIKEIYEFYKNSYKRYSINPKVFILGQIFDLNVTGTRYDFLNSLNPRVEIKIIKGFKEDPGRFVSMKRTYDAGGNLRIIGTIELNVSHFMDNGLSMLHHEMLHFIQELIRISKNTKILGGLPNLPLVKKIMKEKGIDVEGERIGKKGAPRIKHAIRPVEYYTNLESLIKRIQRNYVLEGKELEANLELWVKDIENKKRFFKKLIDENANILYTLRDVKFNEELYRIYLQEITKRFILNDKFLPETLNYISDMEQLKDYKHQASSEKEELMKKKLASRVGKRESSDEISGSKYKKGDFSGFLTIDNYEEKQDFSNIDGESELGTNEDVAEIMFSKVGLTVGENDKIKVNLSFDNLNKLFSNIRKMRDAESLHVLKCNYDFMADNFAKEIEVKLKSSAQRRGVISTPTKQEILSIFYPPPYIDCKTDEEEGYFI